METLRSYSYQEKWVRNLGIVAFLLLSSQSCHSDNFDMDYFRIDYDDPEAVFNQNVQSIRQLVQLLEDDMVLSSVDSSDAHCYVLNIEKQIAPIIFCRNTESLEVKWPSLSIAPKGTKFYWTIGGEYLSDASGKEIGVKENIPVFRYSDGQWLLLIDGVSKEIAIDFLTDEFTSISIVDEGLVFVTFPSSYQLTISTTSFHLPSVPQKAFYKDVFLDAGIGLTPRKYLYAARYLGLSTECISLPRTGATAEDSILQDAIIAGNEQDNNGRLLYPDGQPRYKLLFVDGGSSVTHGKSLSEKARRNMQQYVQNGGSYVGTCAGAFFASNGYDGNADYPYYLNAFPETMNHTGLAGISTGMFIETNSPLLKYYDYGGDYYVSDIRHNKGGYPVALPPGVEVLARFDYPEKADVHKQPSAWSYKPATTTGRIVLEGSHPEEVSNGERRDFTAALMLYAIDGLGLTPLKGFLQNGQTRVMAKGTDADDPLHAKIGDMQCHHFAVNIPQDVEDVSISLVGDSVGDLSLSLNRFTFAYPENAQHVSEVKGSSQSLSFPSLEAGIWYVCVQCNNTVDVTETAYGQAYNAPTGILNGIPYKITVSWKEKEAHRFKTSMRAIGDPAIEQSPMRPKAQEDYYGLDGIKLTTPTARTIYVQDGKKIITNK